MNIEQLQNSLNQSRIDNPKTMADELLIIQKPLALQVQSIVATLQLLKTTMPTKMFNTLIKSLQGNITSSLEALLVLEEEEVQENNEVTQTSNDLTEIIANASNDSDVISQCVTTSSDVMLNEKGEIVKIR